MGIEGYNPTPEEQAELEKSRALSDAELLQKGAEYKIDEFGEKRLEVTDDQLDYLKHGENGTTSNLEVESLDSEHKGISGQINVKGVKYDVTFISGPSQNTASIRGEDGTNIFIKGYKAKEFFDAYINFAKPSQKEKEKEIADSILGK